MVEKLDNKKEKWLFTEERIRQSPSIKLGMTELEEITERQSCANLIRQIGNHLHDKCKRPSHLAMNTAMVYMHRFYVFHSFQKYPAKTMAPCMLFLAAKVEETPIKLAYVIKTYKILTEPLHKGELLDEMVEKLSKEVIANENVLLQTLGFDVSVSHPHQFIVMSGEMMGLKKKETKYAYDFATNCLHFTTMCLKFSPQTVACICLLVSIKKENLFVDRSFEGIDWWNYLVPNLEIEAVESMTRQLMKDIEPCQRQFNKWMKEMDKDKDNKRGGN